MRKYEVEYVIVQAVDCFYNLYMSFTYSLCNEDANFLTRCVKIVAHKDFLVKIFLGKCLS